MPVPEIDLTDPAVLADPVGAHAAARAESALARLLIPGLPMWAVLRHEPARALFAGMAAHSIQSLRDVYFRGYLSGARPRLVRRRHRVGTAALGT